MQIQVFNSQMKQLLPHSWRQALKRRLFVVRDMRTRLQTLKRAGFHCTGAVDAGAYRGDWTQEFWNVYPGVPVLLVEPQPTPQSLLRHLVTTTPGSEVISVALSDRHGTASFVLEESNSGLRSNHTTDGLCVDVPCITLAEALATRSHFVPNLLKLDLQGHELQAMQGAGCVLQQFEVIITEFSVIPIGNVPAFAEVNRFLELQGYQLYDVLPQYDRPLDGALWQLDVFYVRRGSSLLSSQSWA